MSVELFGEISGNYGNAAGNLWGWHKSKNFIIRVITFPWIVFASIIMKIASIIFGFGVIFDVLSIWLENQRHLVIEALESLNENISRSKLAYISSPIKAAFLAPIALFLGIFPKWSSTIMALGGGDEISGGTDHGFFWQLSKQYFFLVKNMFSYSFSHGFIFGLIGLVLSVIVTPIALVIAIIFAILIILDALSWFVELIREFIVWSSSTLARKTGNSLLGSIFYPTLLTLLVPLYIALLIIPKISSQTDA